MTHPHEPKDPTWFERPGNVRLLILVLVVAAGATVVAEFVFGMDGHFSFEGWPLFFAAAGFAAYTVIVLGAKLLRRVVMRPEDYYDR